MLTMLRIRFDTAFGQAVRVVVDDEIVDLDWLGQGWWGVTADLPAGAEYHYEVVADGDPVHVEQPPFRHSPQQATLVVDRWRSWSGRPYASALFTKALASRHCAAADPGTGTTSFVLTEPAVPAGATPAIVGSTKALGEWDPAGAVPMVSVGYPEWAVSFDVEPVDVEYKYVLLDGAGTLLEWEGGDNRRLPAADKRVVNDDRMVVAPFRAAGVAVPVFSLRTETDVGCGQFSDLKPFADWAKSIGMAVVQLLPVNDTVLDHDWDDSYPYNPISVHALHPLYVDVAAIPGHGIAGDIATARAAFVEADEIDYPAVMASKWELLRSAYRKLSPSLDGDSEFEEFVDHHWTWLGPYSAWCLLRDRFGVGDPAEWSGYERFSDELVSALADHESPDYNEIRFHWFVQYHLYRQLEDAADYARSIGIAFKGDLPIGVAPESAEVWTNPDLFHVGTQTGAPPDLFAREGQNWGFPTYDWDRMAQDGFQWWVDRFRAFAAYVDVYRIDHVLGFFRIWEIPGDGFDGLVGHFRPSLPWSEEDLLEVLGEINLADLARPSKVPDLEERFGKDARDLAPFFDPHGQLKAKYSQQEICRFFAEEGSEWDRSLRRLLLDVAADLMIVEVDGGYAPAIAWRDSTGFKGLDEDIAADFDDMALDFFYRRHDEQWELQGRGTLPAVVEATEMLACGEDLGMVPDIVPRLMNEMGLLSLEIERMPKRLGEWIADPASAPYMSVVSPGTHDTSTLRQWWEEDPDFTLRYWKEALGQLGDPPEAATTEVMQTIMRRQLGSPAMLAIVPIADLLGIDAKLRRQHIHAERINDPANRRNRWRYRMHLSITELAAAAELNNAVAAMVAHSGRGLGG